MTSSPPAAPPAPEVAAKNGAAPLEPPQVPAQRQRPRRRTLIIAIVVGAVLIGAAIWGYRYWLDSQRYLRSDDALVDADMAAIAAPGSGTLTIWRVQQGEAVRAGQVLGVVRGAPSASTAANFNILSPIDGTVLRVDAKLGQVIGAAQPLAYVADLQHLRVTTYIDETAIRQVRVGQPVDVTVDATGSASYNGHVESILPAAASQFALIPSSDRSTGNFTKVTQRVEVRVALDNAANMQLYPGENANVRIHIAP